MWKKNLKIILGVFIVGFLVLVFGVIVDEHNSRKEPIRNHICDYGLVVCNGSIDFENKNIEEILGQKNEYYSSDLDALYAFYENSYPNASAEKIKKEEAEDLEILIFERENKNYILKIYGGIDWKKREKAQVCFFKKSGDRYSYPIIFTNYVEKDTFELPEQYEDEDRIVGDLINSHLHGSYFNKVNDNGKHLYFGFCMNEHNNIEIMGKKVEKIEKVEIRDGYYFWYIEDDGEISSAVESAWKYGEATFADMIEALGIKVG